MKKMVCVRIVGLFLGFCGSIFAPNPPTTTSSKQPVKAVQSTAIVPYKPGAGAVQGYDPRRYDANMTYGPTYDDSIVVRPEDDTVQLQDTIAGISDAAGQIAAKIGMLTAALGDVTQKGSDALDEMDANAAALSKDVGRAQSTLEVVAAAQQSVS